MGRTYFRRTAMAATALGLAGLGQESARLEPSLVRQPPDEAGALRDPGSGRRDSRWKLLVLEQIKSRPFCWEERDDGLIKPTLNSSTSAESAAAIWTATVTPCAHGGADSDKRYRLKLEQDGNRLVLVALEPDRGERTIVARANQIQRDKNAFVKLTLSPGWSLERRAYKAAP